MTPERPRHAGWSVSHHSSHRAVTTERPTTSTRYEPTNSVTIVQIVSSA
jgi:hypothetical protein